MQQVVEKIDLNRYEASGLLGIGADYEVRAAVDRQTGQQVVLKRAKPQMVSRGLHGNIETRTEHAIEVFQKVGHLVPYVSPILGYTDRANHDAYFRESLKYEYRVTVLERALGIPLVGDPMSRITGVPIGAPQNLFALFPLGHQDTQVPFVIQQQLLDVEEAFHQAGYLLLDLRPQNVFFRPLTNTISVIDCGGLIWQNPAQPPRQDIHYFYVEMLKFYTTPQEPPQEAKAYRDPYGQRPIINFQEEVEDIAGKFSRMADPKAREAALNAIGKVRRRAYSSFQEFRQDLDDYLQAVAARNGTLANLPQARKAWREALEWLREDHWRRFIFNPEVDLADYVR